ncbi:sulfatase-like hydrolase/transferase [Schlesneria paludicola]|uniref:sulfatase-like hydrolase/transferase n=1 Tax=Schlesneria paludicola TaxID=360056 RepID=UPI00029A1688|nr:sulfatase-like hydrolase/transferase [Schlesneria paludicola]
MKRLGSLSMSIGFWLAMTVTSLAAPPPNLVIFLADDAGWGDYSHSGNQQVSTPNIDSIAKGGVSLDRFFVCPVCAPTRAEFLTGRYHPRGGVRGVSTGLERLDLDEKTLADAFQAAGYATGAFGKWHNGSQWPYHPTARGFDEYFGYTAGHWGEYFDAPLEDHGEMVRTKGYIVDVCTDRALQFIDAHQQKPFLCYVPFTTPHSPWAAPESDWMRFRDRPLSQLASEPDQEVPEHTRCALAMIENQDRNVGRVLTRLHELKLDDNTIVIYFSDNGPNTMRWNGGMKGKKGGTDEGGVRSVCYLKWPARLPAGLTISQISGAIDLLPTLTALAGVTRVGDKPLDGRDLSPLLLNQSVDWPDRPIFSTWAGKVSVRTQHFRLDDQGQLFDMLADPGQRTPIQDHETTAKLTTAVEEWKRTVLNKTKPLENSTGGAIANSTAGRKGISNNSVDPRPIPVGYHKFPLTMLPARDGEPRGQVKRSSSAPNCSYFINWTSTSDSLVWMLNVNTTGKYEVTIDYTCPESDVGSQIELNCGTNRLSGQVSPGWDPPLYTNQDTLPRPTGESQMKDFRSLRVGILHLDQGQAPLILRATEIPGKTVMDVRRVNLRLLPANGS